VAGLVGIEKVEQILGVGRILWQPGGPAHIGEGSWCWALTREKGRERVREEKPKGVGELGVGDEAIAISVDMSEPPQQFLCTVCLEANVECARRRLAAP
jgi:hypothetical protein